MNYSASCNVGQYYISLSKCINVARVIWWTRPMMFSWCGQKSSGLCHILLCHGKAELSTPTHAMKVSVCISCAKRMQEDPADCIVLLPHRWIWPQLSLYWCIRYRWHHFGVRFLGDGFRVGTNAYRCCCTLCTLCNSLAAVMNLSPSACEISTNF